MSVIITKLSILYVNFIKDLELLLELYIHINVLLNYRLLIHYETTRIWEIYNVK